MKRFITQLEKLQEVLENLLDTFSNVGATMYYPLQSRLGLLMRERLYSTSAEIVTINGETDDTHYAANLL